MAEYTVLLVEDNPADADLIKEYLDEDQSSDYEVIEAATLAEAMDIMKKQNINLVLLDLTLPDSRGLDTVRTLLADHSQVVLIILTGLKDHQTALQAVRFGAQDYIEKDRLTPSLLHRSISYAFERKKAMRERIVLFTDLGKALEELQALEAILPICGSCKRIQDDNGNWQTLEEYIKASPKKAVTQLICPQCQKELYSDLE